jgi:PAS domain S-box-containing protein
MSTSGRRPTSEEPERDVERLLVDLETHQFELEMQNEELRRVQRLLEQARERYFKLYDLAPVGYVTLDARGTVVESNLAAARLLGAERSRVVGRPLGAFLAPDGADVLHIHLEAVVGGSSETKCTVALRRPGESHPLVRLEVHSDVSANGVGMQHRVILLGIDGQSALHDGDAASALGEVNRPIAARVEEQTATLARLNRELRQTLAYRTAELAASRLNLVDAMMRAQDGERRRIATELHDDLGQRLSSLGVGLERIKGAESLTSARAEASALQEVTEHLAVELSRLAKDLHPRMLDDLGFAAALEQHVRSRETESGLACHLELIGLPERELPKRIAATLYRVAQEAITNVLKHANAMNISVIVSCTPSHVRLVVEDDGDGFDTATSAPGLGLTSVRERAALLGGWANVESSREEGTSIVVQLPLATEGS